ncbi:MAG: hypothetical protein M0R37_02305 [Bacteroidales bacterium]|nr:hypothetical protein [Bacteroidales bacterium]
MDNLKNYINNHRDDFEEEALPLGHKIRFYIKNGIDIKKYLIAAAILILGVVSPILYEGYHNTGPEKYKQILSEKEEQISGLTETMNEKEKKNILMILDQLVKEVIPLEEQLPETMKADEKNDIISNYYKTKIEGAKKLLAYAESIE